MKTTKHHIILCCFFTFILTSDCFAQIVGSNCFLKGTYAEVGINNCGVYGSNAPAPAGYHPNVFSGLGFVADSDIDGWGTGTPNYCGDYFLPGTPEEGFGIQIGPSSYYNTNQACFPSSIVGSITSYSYASGEYHATWEGDIASANMHVIQETILPDSALYFISVINFCNEGVTSLNDVYYSRNVDPDQDEPFGFSFSTTNTIESNPPNDCQALVTAEGDVYGCFLGMGAIDTMARASYGCFFTTDGTPYNMWHGLSGTGFVCSGDDYETDVGDSKYCDCATQISFYIPSIAPGECEEIKFVYILDIDDLDEALAATGSYGLEADGVDITDSAVTLLCVEDTVKLQILGGDGFDWVWTPAAGLDVDTGTIVHASPDTTTTYLATGYATCDTLYQEVEVIVPTPPVANAGPDLFLCMGDTIQLDGSGGLTYIWQPPVYLSSDTIEDPFVENPLTNMFYQLIAYNSLGCSDTDNVTVTLYTPPTVSAGEDQTMIIGGFAQLNAAGAVSYSWTPEESLSNPIASNPFSYAEDTTVYTVIGVDAHGCSDTDSVTVFVLDDIQIVSPNAFTPNGDGLNDTYKPILVGAGQIDEFEVYNRWGVLLYKSISPLIGWDGTYQNKAQEVGTYIIIIKGEDGYGVALTKNATLILMR